MFNNYNDIDSQNIQRINRNSQTNNQTNNQSFELLSRGIDTNNTNDNNNDRNYNTLFISNIIDAITTQRENLQKHYEEQIRTILIWYLGNKLTTEEATSLNLLCSELVNQAIRLILDNKMPFDLPKLSSIHATHLLIDVNATLLATEHTRLSVCSTIANILISVSPSPQKRGTSSSSNPRNVIQIKDKLEKPYTPQEIQYMHSVMDIYAHTKQYKSPPIPCGRFLLSKKRYCGRTEYLQYEYIFKAWSLFLNAISETCDTNGIHNLDVKSLPPTIYPKNDNISKNTTNKIKIESACIPSTLQERLSSPSYGSLPGEQEEQLETILINEEYYKDTDSEDHRESFNDTLYNSMNDKFNTINLNTNESLYQNKDKTEKILQILNYHKPGRLQKVLKAYSIPDFGYCDDAFDDAVRRNESFRRTIALHRYTANQRRILVGTKGAIALRRTLRAAFSSLYALGNSFTIHRRQVALVQEWYNGLTPQEVLDFLSYDKIREYIDNMGEEFLKEKKLHDTTINSTTTQNNFIVENTNKKSIPQDIQSIYNKIDDTIPTKYNNISILNHNYPSPKLQSTLTRQDRNNSIVTASNLLQYKPIIYNYDWNSLYTHISLKKDKSIKYKTISLPLPTTPLFLEAFIYYANNTLTNPYTKSCNPSSPVPLSKIARKYYNKLDNTCNQINKNNIIDKILQNDYIHRNYSELFCGIDFLLLEKLFITLTQSPLVYHLDAYVRSILEPLDIPLYQYNYLAKSIPIVANIELCHTTRTVNLIYTTKNEDDTIIPILHDDDGFINKEINIEINNNDNINIDIDKHVDEILESSNQTSINLKKEFLPNNPIHVRALLILLEYPGIDDVQMQNTLSILFKLLSLSIRTFKQLITWLCNYPIDRLSRLINITQHYLTLNWLTFNSPPIYAISIYELYQYDTLLSPFRYALDFLTVLYTSAQYQKSILQMTSPINNYYNSCFYILKRKVYNLLMDPKNDQLPSHNVLDPSDVNSARYIMHVQYDPETKYSFGVSDTFVQVNGIFFSNFTTTLRGPFNIALSNRHPRNTLAAKGIDIGAMYRMKYDITTDDTIGIKNISIQDNEDDKNPSCFSFSSKLYNENTKVPVTTSIVGKQLNYTQDKLVSIYRGTIISLLTEMFPLNDTRTSLRYTYIPLQRFYNYVISDSILEMNLRLATYHIIPRNFSILQYPLILTPTAKSCLVKIRNYRDMTTSLQYDISEPSSYFVMNINRSTLLYDALIVMKKASIKDLRKQLRVCFDNEEGIDVGGVMKEFFQLFTQELVKDKASLFVFPKDESCRWFNPFNSDDDTYESLGVFLGLAIRNNIPVKLNFPTVLYKKLRISNLTLSDLSEVLPDEASNLIDFLEFYGSGPIRTVFCATFSIVIPFVVPKKLKEKLITHLKLNKKQRHLYNGSQNIVDKENIKFLQDTLYNNNNNYTNYTIKNISNTNQYYIPPKYTDTNNIVQLNEMNMITDKESTSIKNIDTIKDIQRVPPPIYKRQNITTNYQIIHIEYDDQYLLSSFNYDECIDEYQDTIDDCDIIVDLIPNGSSIPVIETNRTQYVDLVINFLLNRLINRQFEAFSKGFYKVISSDIHLIHTDEEFSMIFGQSDVFCITDLQKSVVYTRGYTERTLIIIHLWEILKALPMNIQRNFLFFCTASDRVPVGGLSKIRLIISRSSGDSTHLPTAQTCFNTLHLPEYSSKEKLQTLLLKAIENATGFGFA